MRYSLAVPTTIGKAHARQTSRAAWPHVLHNKQYRQQQQREVMERTDVGMSSSEAFYMIRQHRGAMETGVIVTVGYSYEQVISLFSRWIHLPIDIYIYFLLTELF